MTLTFQRVGAATSELPPIALLHGFASSASEDFGSADWSDALAAAGRTGIAIDLPGHGANTPVEGAATDAASTSAVTAAILATIAGEFGTADAVDVVGYSLGGRLGWELPGQSAQIRRVVLGGVSPFEPFSAVSSADLEVALGGADPANPLVGMMAGMISAPGRDTASLAKLIVGLASEPFNPAANAPQVPALLVAGSEDQMTQGIEGLVEALPAGSLERVPGDHRGALDSAEFRAVVVAFLS